MPDLPPDHYVMGIDPGMAKCGVAVLSLQGKCMTRSIVPRHELENVVPALAEQYPLKAVVIGDRTGSREIQTLIRRLLKEQVKLSNTVIHVISEHYSSVEARRRFLSDHRKGWRKLVPIGLQTPSRPFDDYTAEVLAQRYLADLDGQRA
ncbi:MAG TPA: Holliday junction resolvase RuvX [Firmicutes bacterium]|jgi:RNase H-fold protein (predicted Holliday junction resolvase)|nr:Holliday junction resolvase RuvX [Bacillota bacterium]